VRGGRRTCCELNCPAWGVEAGSEVLVDWPGVNGRFYATGLGHGRDVVWVAGGFCDVRECLTERRVRAAGNVVGVGEWTVNRSTEAFGQRVLWEGRHAATWPARV